MTLLDRILLNYCAEKGTKGILLFVHELETTNRITDVKPNKEFRVYDTLDEMADCIKGYHKQLKISFDYGLIENDKITLFYDEFYACIYIYFYNVSKQDVETIGRKLGIQVWTLEEEVKAAEIRKTSSI
jgi:hypothetical protein